MEVNNGEVMFHKNASKIMLEATGDSEDVSSWFLMGSPLPATAILALYLLFVLKIGPAIMKNREPYRFHNIIPLYNAVQVLISCFLLYTCVNLLSLHGLVPKTCVIEGEHTRRRLVAAMYYYLMAKFSELLDTVFFVLRKKDNQVSFLHVYHHTLMVFVSWTALKYEPTYALLFLGMLNSFVHVIMYTYYGLSSFPNMAKYLWWKKYITSLQLIQFVLVLIHFGVASAKSECSPSYIMSAAMAINGTLFLYLFGSFYVKTYNKKSKAKPVENNKTNLLEETKSYQEMDEKLYQNGKINGTNYTSASITLNDKYRIRFNLESKKST